MTLSDVCEKGFLCCISISAILALTSFILTGVIESIPVNLDAERIKRLVSLRFLQVQVTVWSLMFWLFGSLFLLCDVLNTFWR